MVQNPRTDGPCLAITTQSRKILSGPSVGKFVNTEKVVEEPAEQHLEESEKPNSSIDMSYKEEEE